MNIPAFTLIEVVIALAVLSIVTALTYNGFSYFTRGTQDYIENTATHLELMGFAGRLERDVALSQTVEATKSGDLLLKFYDGSKLEYQLRQGYFTRISKASRDSIPVQSIRLKTVTNPVHYNSEALVTGISLDALLFDQIVPIYFFKEYFAAQHLPGS